MNTDHGPSTSQPANEATLTLKDHVFGHGTTTSTYSNPKKNGIVKLKRRKEKGKGKGKGGFKRIGDVYIGEEQTQDNDWWSEEDSVLVVQGQERQEMPFERKEHIFLR